MAQQRYVYQSLKYAILSSYVKVNGVIENIVFSGGQLSPSRVNGKFITMDPDMQKALDKSPMYGVDWIRIDPKMVAPAKVNKQDDGEPITERTPPPTLPPPLPPPYETGEIEENENTNVNPDTQTNAPVTPTVITGLTNFQQVRQYMKEQPGVNWNDIKSSVDCIAKAKAMNIQFPDWLHSPSIPVEE